MKILIVEDIKEMSMLIDLYLRKAGMSTVVSETAETALIALHEEAGGFDLIVLDINLPGMNGFQFLETMRRDFDVPVLILSARGTEEDMINGLSLGADEYVTKPFSPRVLAARVEALVRRSRNQSVFNKQQIRFGDYCLDCDSFILKKDGERLHIPKKELDILIMLAKEEGKPFTPEDIYKHIWGDSFGDITTVAVHIQRIRKKIEPDPSTPVFLKTNYGRGYFFDAGGSEE